MRRAGNQNLAVACMLLLFLSAALHRIDALAFSSVSSRIHSQQRLSRALARPRFTRREKRTLLRSTAAPERVSTTTRTTDESTMTTQLVITNNMPDALTTTTDKSTTTHASTTTTQLVIPNNMPDALNRFFLGPNKGPIGVVGMLFFMTAWRLSLSPLTPLDAALFGGMALFWCIQEHVIHDKLLHSQFAWMGRDIHEAHHEKPYFNISIDPAWLMIAWLSVAHALFRFLLPLSSSLSATLGYASFGLLYEWAHYIVHTRVKPPNAFWKRVRDNHIKHHLVDDRYWLSFTLPMVDDLFGTNPSVHEVKREHALKHQTSRNCESKRR